MQSLKEPQLVQVLRKVSQSEQVSDLELQMAMQLGPKSGLELVKV